MPSKIPSFPLRLRQEDKERFAAAAREEGIPLNEWFRRAGEARLRPPAAVQAVLDGPDVMCLRRRGCPAALHVGDCPERQQARTVVAHDQISDLGGSPYRGRDTRDRPEVPAYMRGRRRLTVNSAAERR